MRLSLCKRCNKDFEVKSPKGRPPVLCYECQVLPKEERDKYVVKDFAKLVFQNSWEYYYYYLNGERLFGGETIEVLWPDGHISQSEVVAKGVQTSVSDHGKVYDQYTETLSFTDDFHGLKIVISLRTKGLKFRVTKQRG